MTSNLNEKIVAYFALISGIAISTVAIFYSVSGLISIYPAAVIPIIVMGITIEVGKLAMTLWLKQNWDSPWLYKITMIPAIIVLMIITSGGVFGFLSKAHSDQSLVSGDAQAKVELIDSKINIVKENIKTEQENIVASRNALTQLDNQVNARLGMGFDDGTSAERSVQIRRSQRTERAALSDDIQESQNKISKLNEELSNLNLEKAPLEAELRKVESEVGPVKYIAALIYGDNPDQNTLERAVRWVTLMIVIVMDPVAILLLLASQYSFQVIRQKNKIQEELNLNQADDIEIKENNNFNDIGLSTSSDPVVSVLNIEENLLNQEFYIETTSTVSIEDTSNLSISDNDLNIKVLDNLDLQTADLEIKIDPEQSYYVQNEEQKESNLWTTTSAVKSISQEEYLDKVRKLKGIS